MFVVQFIIWNIRRAKNRRDGLYAVAYIRENTVRRATRAAAVTRKRRQQRPPAQKLKVPVT